MRTLAVIAALLMATAPVLAAPSIVGDFQAWNPADPASELTIDGNGVYVLTVSFVAGSYVYKAVDGDAWGLDFPGNNQPITLAAAGDVTFYVNLGATVGAKEGDEYVFDSLHPPIVCGSFMSELGGIDWDQTDPSTTVMSDGDADGVWTFQSIIPSGSYAFKIVLNNNWDQNTSPSGNVVFVSDGTTPVTFTYDMATNTTDVQSSAPPALIDARIDATMGYVGQNPMQYLLQFSEDMDQTTAENAANYAMTGGPGAVVVDGVELDMDDASLVHLTTFDVLEPGYDYTVTVTGVESVGGTPVDPSNNTDCFYLHKVEFSVNMQLYFLANGETEVVNLQGDTYPLTWDICEGAYMQSAGDSVFFTEEYFTMGHECGAYAESTQVKYKYIADCMTWEGDYDFGHYVTLDPNSATQAVNVWWNDVAPSDNITCDVGVRFQVTELPETFSVVEVYGSAAPLDWVTGTALYDDGTNGDLTASDGVYSALVTFPTGTYRFLEYKYAVDAVFECDTYPNRSLELDDVDGCMPIRVGPMELMELWDWCDTVTTVPETQLILEQSWGVIKSMYR